MTTTGQENVLTPPRRPVLIRLIVLFLLLLIFPVVVSVVVVIVLLPELPPMRLTDVVSVLIVILLFVLLLFLLLLLLLLVLFIRQPCDGVRQQRKSQRNHHPDVVDESERVREGQLESCHRRCHRVSDGTSRRGKIHGSKMIGWCDAVWCCCFL